MQSGPSILIMPSLPLRAAVCFALLLCLHACFFALACTRVQPAFHQVRSLKAGPLTKQGSLFKSWKKRLFVLQESFLLYYVSAADVSPRGALWIRECCVREEPEVSRLQSAKCGSPVYCFSLQCHKSWNIEAKRVFKERTYLLLADSFQDISDWMAILRTMARASADIDLDWEQSYAQTFAQKTDAALDHSGQQLALLSGSAASASGSTDNSGVRAHKRNKSKSSSKSLHGHGHGHVRNVSGVAQHSSQGSSGGSSSARPRTPLANASTHSLSSSAAASLLHGRALERERELRDRDRDRDRDAATSLSPALNASDGGASTSGAASQSMSGGATPRASVSRSRSRSRSLSPSHSSLAQHSITQRARPDSDADLQPHPPPHLSAHAYAQQPPHHAHAHAHGHGHSPLLQPNRAAAPAATHGMGAASALSGADWMAAQARDRDAHLFSSSQLLSSDSAAANGSARGDPPSLQASSPPRAQRLGESAPRCPTPLAGQAQSDSLTPRQHAPLA